MKPLPTDYYTKLSRNIVNSPLYRISHRFSGSAGEKSAVAGFGLEPPEVIPQGIAALFAQCQSFKTLKDHARECWSKLSLWEKTLLIKPLTQYHVDLTQELFLSPKVFERMLEGIFQRFAEQGLFISHEVFVDLVRRASQAEPMPPPIASLGVVTCNRVSALSSCLQSYIENAARWQRKNDFVVLDDSPQKETRESYRTLAQSLAKRFSVPIVYAGVEEKKAFVEALAARGIPEHVVQFALFDTVDLGMTCGANRNALLLHTAGDMFLSVDDDTVCRISKSPEHRQGMKIGNEHSNFRLWFYPDRASALASLSPVDEDCLRLHEAQLGKSLGRCVAEHADLASLDTSAMDGHLLRMLQRREGRVLFTFNGLLGDSGSNSPEHNFFVNGVDRERLLASEEIYRTAFRSREECKAADQTIVNHVGPCMSTFLGMDNREILPPFFPCFRNADELFGVLIGRCKEDALAAYLPWVFVHAPEESRYHAADVLRYYDPLWPEEAVRLALKSFSRGPQTMVMGDSLRLAGEHLMRIGSMIFSDYQELFTQYRWLARCEEMASYDQLLKQHSKSPSYWVKDVHALLDRSRKAMRKDQILAPLELVEKFGKEEAAKEVQKMVFRYGELLTWWPEMVRSAKELRQKEIRLAQSVESVPLGIF